MKKYTVELTAEQLKKLGIEPENKNWRAKKGGNYWFEDDGGIPDKSREENDNIDDYRHETGNYRKTEEEVENRIALKKHIYKFPEPEEGDIHWLDDENDWYMSCSPNISIGELANYHAGVAMHINTTKEDRVERLRLLKLVYKK